MPVPAERQATGWNSTSGSSTSYPATMASAVLVGDLLFAVFSASITTNALVVSDNVNGSWTRIGNAFSSGTHSQHVFYFSGSAAASAGTLIVTVSAGGATFSVEGQAFEYTNIK